MISYPDKPVHLYALVRTIKQEWNEFEWQKQLIVFTGRPQIFCAVIIAIQGIHMGHFDFYDIVFGVLNCENHLFSIVLYL